MSDQPEPVDDKPQDLPSAFPVTLMRPELAEFARKEMRRQIELRRVRTPAGLAGLFPGLGTRKR